MFTKRVKFINEKGNLVLSDSVPIAVQGLKRLVAKLVIPKQTNKHLPKKMSANPWKGQHSRIGVVAMIGFMRRMQI